MEAVRSTNTCYFPREAPWTRVRSLCPLAVSARCVRWLIRIPIRDKDKKNKDNKNKNNKKLRITTRRRRMRTTTTKIADGRTDGQTAYGRMDGRRDGQRTKGAPLKKKVAEGKKTVLKNSRREAFVKCSVRSTRGVKYSFNYGHIMDMGRPWHEAFGRFGVRSARGVEHL